MAIKWQEHAIDQLGENRISFDREMIEERSQDQNRYSPILSKQLLHKIADGVAVPQDENDLTALLRFAYEQRIPVTMRGAGTGMRGQSVPLRGGLVLDTSQLNRIIEIGQGYAVVQAGVRLGDLEKAARATGQELRIMPSNAEDATAAGFVCAGSRGVGSVTWGSLADGNVNELTVITLEKEPRKKIIAGDDLLDYVRQIGVSGAITEIVLPLATATEWQQVVICFPHYADALLFADSLSKDHSIQKRLVSPLEWPLPTFFGPAARMFQQGKAAVLMEIGDGHLREVYTHARRHKGEISHYAKTPSEQGAGKKLSKYSWHHTLDWAKQVNPAYTYIEATFLSSRFLEQAARIKYEYGDEVLLHHEWIRHRGVVLPFAIPIIRFTDRERLYELMSYFQSIGVSVDDPHTYYLESGSRTAMQSMLAAKKGNDPLGLLNPGKLPY